MPLLVPADAFASRKAKSVDKVTQYSVDAVVDYKLDHTPLREDASDLGAWTSYQPL